MTAYDPVKVLYVISSLANEGPTRVLLNLVRGLDPTRYTPSIVTLTQEKDTSLLAEFQASQVPVVQLGTSASGVPHSTLHRLRNLREMLRKGAYQIAHAHCPRSLFFLIAAKPKSVRTAYTVHVYPDEQYKVIHGRIKGRIITAASNMALKAIDQPIACADSVAAEYREKRRYSLTSVNNGIEPMDLVGFPGRSEMLRTLGLDPDRRYLLYVGRLSAEKRITTLARAFAQIAPVGTDLVIVGAGPEETKLRDIDSPHVHLMGFHRDIRPFLAGCDYYVSPSATEGLANTLLEAMSVGLPSLLSLIPSHTFFAQKCDGFVAATFDPTSTDSIVNGLNALSERDSEDVRRGIRSNFASKFHAQVMVNGYQSIYEQMML